MMKATVEETGQNRQEDCRMYEDMSGAEPGADSVPVEQVTRTVAEAVPSEYDDVKVYQRLKV